MSEKALGPCQIELRFRGRLCLAVSGPFLHMKKPPFFVDSPVEFVTMGRARYLPQPGKILVSGIGRGFGGLFLEVTAAYLAWLKKFKLPRTMGGSR